MARYRRYVDRLDRSTVINLDKVAVAQIRDTASIYVWVAGGGEDAHVLKVTIDAFLDHLNGDDQT